MSEDRLTPRIEVAALCIVVVVAVIGSVFVIALVVSDMLRRGKFL